MAHPTDVHIGQRLRDARVAAGLTQTALGESIGVTFQQLQKYESGANRIAGSRLWQLCQTLGVNPDYFFEGLNGDERTAPPEAAPAATTDRLALEAARDFSAIPSRAVRRSLRRLITTLTTTTIPDTEESR